MTKGRSIESLVDISPNQLLFSGHRPGVGLTRRSPQDVPGAFLAGLTEPHGHGQTLRHIIVHS